MKNRKKRDELGMIMGSATGETEQTNVAGGWAGTDDATSTAPSDQIGNPPIPEEDKPFDVIARDFDDSVRMLEEEENRDAAEADEIREREELSELAQRLAAEARNAQPLQDK
jgi:hypothetical protein